MRDNKGVTLLVLIITVVILAILALVTINLTLHRNTITKVRETGNEITSKIESDEEKTESLKNEYKQMDDAIVSWNTSNPPISEIGEVNSSLKGKTISSITIEAIAASSNSEDMITYQLWISNQSGTGYTKVNTSAATISNTSVELTASNLLEYSQYYYYVIAKIGDKDKKSSVASVLTKCSGKTNTCSRTANTCPGYKEKSCSSCYATGYYQPITNCSQCNGTGKYSSVGSSVNGVAGGIAGPCQACNGTGKVLCTTCRGSGKSIVYPCDHLLRTQHTYYTCSHASYNNNTTSSQHYYCAHNAEGVEHE